MNQNLEDIAKAIFKSWFIDFDPVKAKAEGRSVERLVLKDLPAMSTSNAIGFTIANDLPGNFSSYDINL